MAIDIALGRENFAGCYICSQNHGLVEVVVEAPQCVSISPHLESFGISQKSCSVETPLSTSNAPDWELLRSSLEMLSCKTSDVISVSEETDLIGGWHSSGKKDVYTSDKQKTKVEQDFDSVL